MFPESKNNSSNFPLNHYQKRARMNQAIRDFFEKQHVMEVETPLLCRHTVTSPHIDSFSSPWKFSENNSSRFYLQTSPEYAMKRLLASGSGDIFQICKTFRNEPCTRYHNPEFSMLEWYRIKKNLHFLMQEVFNIVSCVMKLFNPPRQTPEPVYFSYRELFLKYANIDPLTATIPLIQQCAIEKNISLPNSLVTKDEWLNFIQVECIEPHFHKHPYLFIYDFPASQGALARLDEKDSRVAHRFEFYLHGIELANGYEELSSYKELKTRFKEDNRLRALMKKKKIAIDSKFLNAMKSGLPECVGVALGLDRLLMCALKENHIKEVLVFTTEET